jgi:lysine-specific demethylase 8
MPTKTRGEVTAIPRISLDEWMAKVDGGDTGREPLVLAGAFADSGAVRSWTPERVAARHGGTKVSVWTGLPAAGSPFDGTVRDHQRVVTLADFTENLLGHPGSYLTQAPLTMFPGLSGGISLAAVTPPPARPESLWVGNSTHSGLHFDLADGLLAQVYGVKTATLVRAGQFSRLYPYPEMHLKSRVDPDDFDPKAFPRFAGAGRFTARLEPGDALFIPRLWWHHLVSDGISMSVNTWFGPARPSGWFTTLLRSGPAVWRRTAYDFVDLGIRKRDFQVRVMSSKPTGLELYGMLSSRTRRRAAAGKS